MLELKNITIALKKDGRPIVENFSFTLQAGDKAVVIGEEGNGKSTLLRFLFDPASVESYCECSGEVTARGRMAYLPQFLPEADAARTLAEYFADAPVYGHTDVLARLDFPLDRVFSDQTLGTLSGGERVKAQLARLLMDDPEVLLLDEPTNDLDIRTLEWLERFIRTSRQPILFISHDETLIENAANVVVHMEQLIRKTQCRITVARCPYSEYLAHRRLNFDRQAQVAQKQRDDYARQMEKWRQIYDRVDHAQRSISRQDPSGGRLLKKKMHTVLSMGKRFEHEKENFLDFPEEEDAILTKFDPNIRVPAGKAVLDLTLPELTAGGRVLARDVRLFVSGSAHIGITGKNGAGKSTLLALLWEALRARTDVTAAFMPQNYEDALDFDKTPVEYLAARYTKAEITKARTYMGSMRFTHEEMTGKISALSGGQKAKIIFLEMVLKNANVLLLDEPTRNFSPLSTPVIRAALKDFGGAILSVSHDRKYLREVCGAVYELREDGLFPLDPETL